ncbi:MAG: transporter substrate-binding domain-containing protein [Mesorhizobium sp.]|nr:transporter substrate-binding domain-containing protein [Mesorhizobium sp.]MCO5164585.1 transporter substrate-binding domain-containing protein [Mesorhizobium sp.]
MRKLLSAAFLTSALFLFGSSTAFSQDVIVTPDVKEAGKLTIASSLAYAPFEFVDAGGAPAGLNIELADAVSKALGVKLDIVTIPFPATIPAIVSGRVKVGWERWCRFLRQEHKVDRPMERTIQHEDTQTVYGRVQGQGCA